MTKKITPKKLSAPRPFRLSDWPKIVVFADVLVGDKCIRVDIGLPKDWRAGLFEVTSLFASGDDVFRQELSRYDVIMLKVDGRNINARVAEVDNTGRVWIFGEKVLRGLARSASLKWPRLFGEPRKPDVKRKKARTNG